MATRIKQEKLIDKVTTALKSSFPGVQLDLETLADGRVGGEIAWSKFNPNDGYADQVKLSKALKEKLGADAAQVGLIFTLTPIQKKVMDEDRLAEEESILSTAKSILRDRRRKARSKNSNGTNGHPALKKRKLTTHG